MKKSKESKVKVEAQVVEKKEAPKVQAAPVKFVRMTTSEIAALIIPGKPIPEDLRPRLTPGQARYWGPQRVEREAKVATQPREKKVEKKKTAKSIMSKGKSS